MLMLIGVANWDTLLTKSCFQVFNMNNLGWISIWHASLGSCGKCLTVSPVPSVWCSQVALSLYWCSCCLIKGFKWSCKWSFSLVSTAGTAGSADCRGSTEGQRGGWCSKWQVRNTSLKVFTPELEGSVSGGTNGGKLLPGIEEEEKGSDETSIFCQVKLKENLFTRLRSVSSTCFGQSTFFWNSWIDNVMTLLGGRPPTVNPRGLVSRLRFYIQMSFIWL